jgi:hypothetical protein
MHWYTKLISNTRLTRTTRLLLLTASLIGVAVVASSCDITLPVTDCSWIHQPDMGGLVCLGANAVALSAGLIAIVLAVLLGVSSVVPH